MAHSESCFWISAGLISPGLEVGSPPSLGLGPVENFVLVHWRVYVVYIHRNGATRVFLQKAACQVFVQAPPHAPSRCRMATPSPVCMVCTPYGALLTFHGRVTGEPGRQGTHLCKPLDVITDVALWTLFCAKALCHEKKLIPDEYRR